MNLIIIGAPRSGTNILRDVLTSLDGIATWPCDEINYIWRHGNVSYPSDEFPVELATPKIKRYISNHFSNIKDKFSADIVVEKTCASSLRVGFINAILPDAKYIFIVRDGIDAAGSATERWTAKLDVPYILEKIRFVPLGDIPYYAFRYLGARIYRIFSNEKRLAFWGPAWDGMNSVVKKNNLNEICALQWQHCVDRAEEALSAMPSDKVINVRYEDFVRHPVDELSRILVFLGKDVELDKISLAVQSVSPLSLGKGRKALGETEVKNLESLVRDTLKRNDYL